MGSLGDYANGIAKDFSGEYRTARNPEGKQFIVVYGGDVETRFDLSDLIRAALPTGVEAYVLEQETRRLPREREDDPRVSYVDLDRVDVGGRCLGGERD